MSNSCDHVVCYSYDNVLFNYYAIRNKGKLSHCRNFSRGSNNNLARLGSDDKNLLNSNKHNVEYFNGQKDKEL